jgi:ADP-ribose pyrophosphatase YjhB (NUDIX family)
VIRETKEETNLDIIDVLPVFGDACGTPGVHHVHWCMAFLCKATGTLKRMEKGRVVWVPTQRLITKPDGTFNSFGEYNSQVQRAIETMEPRELDWFKSSIVLESEFLL